MQAKAITKTTVETTGVEVSLNLQEARDVLGAIEARGLPALFDTVEAMRDALGMTSIDFMVNEAIGEGHYDTDLLSGRRIAAIKRLRSLFPVLGLKRAKNYMDARYNLLREANSELARLHRARCTLPQWECELLNGTNYHV